MALKTWTNLSPSLESYSWATYLFQLDYEFVLSMSLKSSETVVNISKPSTGVMDGVRKLHSKSLSLRGEKVCVTKTLYIVRQPNFREWRNAIVLLLNIVLIIKVKAIFQDLR